MDFDTFIKLRDIKIREADHLKVVKSFYPYLRSVSGDAGLLPSTLEKMLGIDLTDISVVTACFNGVNDGSKAPYDNVDLYIKLNNDIKVFVYGRNQENVVELKENNITIADTESAAIAYICKANNIECIIIKGISDFPTNEQENLNGEQLNSFIANIPIIMNKIVDGYLPLVLKSSVKYNRCKNFIHIKQREAGDLNHRFESPVNLFSRSYLSIFSNWFLSKILSTKFALKNRKKKYL